MKLIPALAVLTLAMLAGCAEQRPVETGNPAPGQSVTESCVLPGSGTLYPAGQTITLPTSPSTEADCAKAGGKWTVTHGTAQ